MYSRPFKSNLETNFQTLFSLQANLQLSLSLCVCVCVCFSLCMDTEHMSFMRNLATRRLFFTACKADAKETALSLWLTTSNVLLCSSMPTARDCYFDHSLSLSLSLPLHLFDQTHSIRETPNILPWYRLLTRLFISLFKEYNRQCWYCVQRDKTQSLHST